jgi:hypothetical protein
MLAIGNMQLAIIVFLSTALCQLPFATCKLLMLSQNNIDMTPVENKTILIKK